MMIYKRKNSEFFHCGPFCSIFEEVFVEVPYFHETCPALKNICFRACDGVGNTN